MTIDRVIASAASRIDKSHGASAPAGPLDSGNDTPGGELPLFSSVLTSSLATDSVDAAAKADVATAVALESAGPPVAESDRALDPAVLLAQILGGASASAVALPHPVEAGVSTASSPGGRAGVADPSPQPTAPGTAGGLPPAAHGAQGRHDPMAGTNAIAVGVPDETVLAPTRRSPLSVASRAPAVEAKDSPGGWRSGEIPNRVDDAGASRADWRLTLAAQTDRGAFLTAPWSPAAGGGFQSLPALRGPERLSARAVFLPLDAASPGSAASASFATQIGAGAPTMATADAPMAPGASSELAHKVHYWVTRGVQSAELQLEAFGGSAVDVSITVQGKEALVEFRTDQAEARRALQDAMPQLREMLRSEGLQLSGGFVGTSAQQQRDGQRNAPETTAAKVGTVMVTGGHTAERIGRPGAATDHSLDVFV